MVASKTYQKLSIFNSGLEDLQVLYLIGKALISYYSDPSLWFDWHITIEQYFNVGCSWKIDVGGRT